MQKPIRKVWYKRVWLYIVGGILLVLTIYLFVQGIRCSIAVKNGEERLAAYNATTVNLSYGDMTYADTIPDNGMPEDKVILSMHGIFGGYDQAYDTVRDFASSYRILAPSRFGYLGSDVMGNGTPSEQVAAYVELLDSLGIDKVYPLATSAGGTTAIRFALDYPERTEGLILYCSAMPYVENLKCSGGVITIILIVLEVSIVIGICISLAFTIWVLNRTNGIPASNMLYHALLQGVRVQSNGGIAAELCTNAVSSLFLLFTLITAYPIFRSIRSDAFPFSTQSTKRLKKAAIMAFMYAIVNPIARADSYKTFATETGLSKMMNLDFIVIAIILFAVAVVFDYGAELQRKSDETR